MNIKDIKIGDRFRKDLGDIKTLASSIQEIGLLQPIVVNQDNELIVGQRRLEACKILGQTEVSTTIVNLDDIIKGEFHENAVRKGFTLSERVAILLEIEKRRLGHRQKKDSNLESFQTENKNKRSVDIVANYTGVSQGQLANEKKLVEMANNGNGFAIVDAQKILDKVDKCTMSVNKALKKLQDQQERNELINSKPVIDLPENIKLILGDCREATKEIPDNSIDLIFTDPPYDEASLPLYRDLGIIAGRVLKNGGSLFTIAGHYALPQIFKYMEEIPGLKYWHILNVIHSGRPARLFHRHVVVGWKPLLWYVKGQKLRTHNYIRDTIISAQPDKILHEMEQSPVEAEHVISRLTFAGPNEIVLDPFMGSGTTGIASIKLNRKFIGIEIDPKTFEVAKANLSSFLSSYP